MMQGQLILLGEISKTGQVQLRAAADRSQLQPEARAGNTGKLRVENYGGALRIKIVEEDIPLAVAGKKIYDGFRCFWNKVQEFCHIRIIIDDVGIVTGVLPLAVINQEKNCADNQIKN